MSQFITVVGNNGTHGALHRAGRRFENGARVRLEVVPNEPTKTIKNRHTGKDEVVPPDPKAPYDKNGNPSMERICEAGHALLKGDPRISINGGDEEAQGAATLIVAGLRSQLAASQAELSDAKLYIAELEKDAADSTALKAELAKVTARNAELEKAVADAAKAAAAAAKKAKDAPAETKPDGSKE